MARTLRQILKDNNRTGTELGLIIMEKLRNQIQGEPLIVSDKDLTVMAKKLSPEEYGIFALYETIYSSVLNIYNFSRQTVFKFYASHNALIAMEDKIKILEFSRAEENVPERLSSLIERICPTFSELQGKTKETYEMMFDAISFIEASNTFIRLLLCHFSISGLNCMQYNTDDFYSLLKKLNENTHSLYKAVGDRVGEAKAVFMDLEETDRKDFSPETKKISEFKEFLRNEPNRVIKNSFSFIMLLQNKKAFKEAK